MAESKMFTEFAPAERASSEHIRAHRKLFEKYPILMQVLDAVPNMVMILNPERQIVYVNQSLFDRLNISIEERELIFGSRPGEVWKCAHAFESVGGCGTTSFCETCGAANAIVSSLNKQADVQECRIVQDHTGNALDFRVWAKPLVLDGELFSIFTVSDISHEKRREVLERIFFHDLLNTAGGLKGSAELFREANEVELSEFQDIILRLSDELIEEIQAQRQLVAAEAEQLAAIPSRFLAEDILHEVVRVCRSHEVAQDKHIKIADSIFTGALITDRTLLRRVLGNMTKNALEAILPGESVLLGCDACEDGVLFWVHNPGVMPNAVQKQIFQRSFTTKGSGRGLGTYSIKMLTENYLKGRVSFVSSAESGTVFKAFCPHLILEKDVASEILPQENKQLDVLRILVAEDNLVNQKLAIRLLERLGHKPVVVGNGKEVLHALEADVYDLVFMDCDMPEMGGIEATQQIRKSKQVQDNSIVIVAMTGHGEGEGRRACLDAGMNDYIQKPVGKDVLLAMLQKWAGV